MPIFKRTFSQDLDLLEQHLTKEIISQTDCKTILTKLITTFENAFNSEFKERMQKYTRFDAQSLQDAMICNMDSIGKYMLEITVHQQRTPQLLKQKKLMQTQDHSNPIQALNVNSLKVDLVVIQNTCSEKEDSNSETASSKSVKESSLNSETKDVHAIKYKMSKAKERCMAYFRSLHSHLQVLSKEDLKGTRIEHGFKRAFMSLFGQDVDTFTKSSKDNTSVQDDSSRSGNEYGSDDGKIIRPIYDKSRWLCLLKTKLLKEVNSRAKIQSNKTINSNKPVDQKSHTQKPYRQIFTGHRFSPNKTYAVFEKTSPRSDLRWKPTGRIFKSVGRGVSYRKLFDSYTRKFSMEKNQVVLKSSAVTTTDASNKRQQQPDSTSSTSTQATTVTVNGNFDL
ncbi:hypothetical protein Tco_0102845 [Tanacetum coccineum]